MRAVVYLLLGLVMVGLAVTVLDGYDYPQIALLSSGTTLAGVGILMDAEKNRN